MAGEYRYLAYDLRTNASIAELPLSNPSFGGVFNGFGPFKAGLVVDENPALFMSATIPERTIVFVERDGVLLPDSGYIIWKRIRKMNTPVALEGSSIASLFRRNRNVANLSYTAADQFAIARALIDAMQAQAGGNVGINTGSGSSGVTRDRNYPGYQRKNIGDALTELGDVINGFDWAVDVAWSAGAPAKNLNLSYPRRGRIAGTTGLIFESGKNLLDYTFEEDGTRSARVVDALGAGDGANMLISTAARTDLIDAGYPLTAETLAFKDVQVQATLDGHANAQVNARAATPTFLTVSIDPDDIDGGLGHWITGDDVQVRISDDNFPATSAGPGYSAYHRILSYKVSFDPGERVDVVLGQVAA